MSAIDVSALFTPLQLGNVTLANRVVMPAMGIGVFARKAFRERTTPLITRAVRNAGRVWFLPRGFTWITSPQVTIRHSDVFMASERSPGNVQPKCVPPAASVCRRTFTVASAPTIDS
jgi:hypothetical protein